MTMTFYEFIETIGNYETAFPEVSFDLFRTRISGPEWTLINNEKNLVITTYCDNEKEHATLQLLYEMHYDV